VSNEQAWLDSLKAGDAVVVDVGGWGMANCREATVARTTKTGITVGQTVFRRKGGDMFGGGMWRGAILRQPTPELLADITEERTRRNALTRIENTLWREQATAKLVRIVAILAEADAA
jgi:hypothetical protein